jgi:hypothetical protein
MRILLITLHLMTISLMSLLSLDWDEPTVKQEIPMAFTKSGTSVVKVKIDKAGLEGFAKLEINIPKGYIVRAMETKGASFTFSEQKIRFVWMSLPQVDQFQITYQLVKNGAEGGLNEISGVFSYIDKSKRKDIAVSSNLEEGSTQNEMLVTQDEMLAYAYKTTLNANNELPTCERFINKVGDDFVVELLVKLNGLKGFLKLQDWASNGCVISKMQNGGATVTVDGANIKYVWFEVPGAEVIAIKYKLTCNSLPETGLTIDGKLSFVVDNQPREIPIVAGSRAVPMPAETQEVKSETNNTDVVAEANPKIETQSKAVEESKPVVNPVVSPKERLKDVPVKNKEPKLNGSVSNGVKYRVQILANHRSVGKAEWKNKFGFEGSCQVENHEGWMKWTHGQFADYKDARDKRVSLTAECPNLPGPFVTAYQDGNRITVQEALMITQQKWVQ